MDLGLLVDGVGVAGPLLAYLDAGTGSMIFQVLVASLVSAGVVFGGAMARLKAFVARMMSKQPSETSAATSLQIHDASSNDGLSVGGVSQQSAGAIDESQQRRAA